MRQPVALPAKIGSIAVPRDDVSRATWRWTQRSLPEYLFAHSVRSYCWGAVLAEREGWTFDRQILWNASLLHDIGLSRIAKNTMCFEVEGAEIARRFLLRAGLTAGVSDRVAVAIILHMRPSVTLDDGVEAVLLDRATGIDVRGDGYEQIESVRTEVTRRYPRREFDRRFVTAIQREVARRAGCQSARLLHEAKLVDWIARSPWRER